MTVPDPNATTAPPDDPDEALAAAIEGHLSSDGTGADPASGTVPSDELPASTVASGDAGAEGVGTPAAGPDTTVTPPFDPFAAPPDPAGDPNETVDLFGLKVTRAEAEQLLTAYQFAVSLTPEQYALLQAPPAAPAAPTPAVGAPVTDWEDLDPAAAQILRAQQAEIAQLRDQQFAAAQAQAVTQHRATVEAAFDRFAAAHGLDQPALEGLAARLHRSEILPSMVAAQGGDIGRAVEAGLYTMMMTDPQFAGRAPAATPAAAAADAEIEARKARASGTASGSGSAAPPVSPLNAPAPPPAAGVPARNAREARAAAGNQMFEQLADEFRKHLAAP